MATRKLEISWNIHPSISMNIAHIFLNKSWKGGWGWFPTVLKSSFDLGAPRSLPWACWAWEDSGKTGILAEDCASARACSQQELRLSSGKNKKALVLLLGTIHVFRSCQNPWVDKEWQISLVSGIGCSQWQVTFQVRDTLQILLDMLQLQG